MHGELPGWCGKCGPRIRPRNSSEVGRERAFRTRQHGELERFHPVKCCSRGTTQRNSGYAPIGQPGSTPMNSMPETRYARSGDNYVAYQVIGEGPFDLVWVPASSHTLTS
jgi:hypothetical protein